MSAPIAVSRLPSPPKEYDQGYMARLTNTLELEKQATSSSSENAKEETQAVSWFIG